MSTISKIKLMLAAVIIVFVTAAIYLSALVLKRQEVLEQVTRYNVAFLLSQAATEHARLEQRLSAFSHDSEVDADEVQLRYDVLINRIKLMNQGDAAEFLEANPAERAIVDELKRAMAAAEPLVDAISRPGNAAKLMRLLAPLDAKMIQLASAGNRYGADRVTEDQRHLISLHLRFSAMAGGLIVCGILLVTLLLWHNMALTRAHHDLHGLADRLRAQEQAATAASRAKSEFLAMMSHEIRTPMNAVIGLSVLANSKLDGESQHLADSIHDSSNNLLRLLNDILDLSKLDAGKVELEAQPFAPAALVDGVVSIFEGQALKKGLLLRAQVDGGLPAALLGDEARLRQVMLNLMSNAIKFTASGHVAIAARCLAAADHTATIEISVADTGIGIAPDRIGCLFNDFLQVDSSINRRYGGTGLGLAICKRIILQMGGDIRVESTLNAGSTFRFALTLPVADISALAKVNSEGADDEFETRLMKLRQPLAILLAEDNATNQLVFTKLLQGFAVDITVAANGRIALEHARRRVFDAVFMDVRMPELDGLEATRAIRALDGANGNVPIIALTANAFADDIKACRDAGMDEFIAKPVRKKMLLEKLAGLLGDDPRFREADVAPEQSVAPRELPVTPPAEVALADVAPVLDHAALDTFIEEIELDGVRETFDAYIADTVGRLALLRTLSCDSDRDRIKIEAHTLKGSSSTFGLTQLSTLGRTLEYGAHAISADDYGDIVERIHAVFAASRDAVEAAMAEKVA